MLPIARPPVACITLLLFGAGLAAGLAGVGLAGLAGGALLVGAGLRWWPRAAAGLALVVAGALHGCGARALDRAGCAAKPPRPDAKYRVVMSDFLARGGDGLGPALASLPPGAIDPGEGREDNFRDAVIDHWVARKAPLVAPAGGRVTFVDDGADCGTGAKLDGQSSH